MNLEVVMRCRVHNYPLASVLRGDLAIQRSLEDWLGFNTCWQNIKALNRLRLNLRLVMGWPTGEATAVRRAVDYREYADFTERPAAEAEFAGRLQLPDGLSSAS